MSNPECQTRLLPDDPVSRDDLGSHPHQRVAEAMAEMILAEPGRKTIGLEGPWGSGKSTTIRLLRGEFDRNEGGEQTALFVFDAWSHRRDPLKRAFITELVRFLNDRGWLSRRRSKKTLDELAKRRELTKTRTGPGLGDATVAVIVSAMLLVVGVPVFAANPDIVNRLLGGALVVVALLVMLGVARKEGLRKAFGFISSVLLQGAAKNTQTIKIRTPEPTSIEFRSAFDKILARTLSRRTERRLVVVIDNLDRVDPEDALTIWSTMRNFFEFSVRSSRECLERFWLVVPYDRGSLERLWQAEMTLPSSDSGEFEATAGAMSPQAARQSSGTKGGPAAAFIDKSFQVRFRVPTPVTSDRRKLFDGLYERAFPDHHDDDLRYATFRIFDSTRSAAGRAATPRDIKLFLNEVGALHRQWPDKEVPPDLEALFVALRDRLGGPEAIKNQDLVPMPLRSLLSTTEWQQYFAGLYFNVAPKIGIQILIGEDIERALRDGDPELLRAQASVAGFGDIGAQVVEEQAPLWISSEPTALPRAAIALDGLGEDVPAASTKRMWGGIQRSVHEGVESWPGFDGTAGRGLGLLVSREPSDGAARLAQVFATSIGRSAPKENDDGSHGPELEAWVAGAVAFLEAATPVEDSSLPLEITVPGEASTYLAVLRLLRKRDVDLAVRRRMRSSTAASALGDEVATQVQEGQVTEADATDYRLLPDAVDGWAWDSIVTALLARLQVSGAAQASEITGLCLLFEHLRDIGAINEGQEAQIVSSGPLFARLGEIKGKNEERAIAACLLPLFLHNPGGNITGPGGGITGQGKSFYDAVKNDPASQEGVVLQLQELVRSQGAAGQVLTEQAYRTDAPQLTEYLVAGLLNLEPGSGQVTANMIVEEFEYLQSILNEESFRDLLRRYWREDELKQVMLSLPVGPQSAGRHLFVYKVASEDSDASYPVYLSDLMGSLDRTQWSASLHAGDGLVELLELLLVDKAAPVTLGWDFEQALEGHVQELATGKVQLNKPQRVSALVDALDESGKEVFLRNVLDSLAGASNARQCLLVLQAAGETLLANTNALLEDADKVVRRVFTRIVLDTKDHRGIAWIQKVVMAAPQLFSEADDSTQDQFRAAVKAVLEEVEKDSNIRPMLKELSEL